MAYRTSQSGLSLYHQFFYNSKFLPLKQYYFTIKYYDKHWQENSGGSALAQYAYHAMLLVCMYVCDCMGNIGHFIS